MLVKAKWNVKDSAGWHKGGEVFNTVEDLGDAVEILEMPKVNLQDMTPDKAVEQKPAVSETETETVQESRPRGNTRRKAK